MQLLRLSVLTVLEHLAAAYWRHVVPIVFTDFSPRYGRSAESPSLFVFAFSLRAEALNDAMSPEAPAAGG